MISNTLSIKDFAWYFERRRLERISLPEGSNTTVDLAQLYKAVFGWIVNNHTARVVSSVTAIVLYGSALKHPGYSWKSRRKYKFFGPIQWEKVRNKANPHDVDVLVVVPDELSLDLMVSGMEQRWYNQYGLCGIRRGMLHVSSIPVEDFLRQAGPVARSAAEHGVLLCTTDTEAGTEVATLFSNNNKVVWGETKDYFLTGQVMRAEAD